MCSTSSEPLPVRSARILDYKESPETGVVFDLEPPAGTTFSRVNITYTEGQERRSMLYKGAQAPQRASQVQPRQEQEVTKCWPQLS